MITAPARGVGFDVVVVTAGNAERAAWWRARLGRTRASLVRADARLVVVEEPWPAGNALGTLLAVDAASTALGADVDTLLAAGAAVVVVHAAGAGTRLRPLTDAHGGDKARLPLPGGLPTPDGPVPLTLLEAVLRNVGLLAPQRTGRLSVCWSDQLVVPANLAPPSADVAISARPLAPPSAATWQALGLARYGVLARAASGRAALVEKVDFDTFTGLGLDASGGLFTSLGAFHLGRDLLAALRALHAPDLVAPNRLDADRGWWMPLTLSAARYARLGGDPAHHARLSPLRSHLRVAVDDVGAAWWWDFGTLEAHAASLSALDDATPASEALRLLLHGAGETPG